MFLLDEWRDWVRHRLSGGLVDDPRARRLALAALVLLTLSALIAADLRPERVQLAEGDIALRSIVAPRDVVDDVATAARQREAVALVPDVYDVDPTVARDQIIRLDAVANAVRNARASDAPLEERIQALGAETGLDLPDSVWRTVLSADEATLGQVEMGTREIVLAILNEPIANDAVELARQRAEAAARAKGFGSELDLFSAALAGSLIAPNLAFNPAETERRREEASRAVEPVVIRQNQVIVQAGEPVTAAQLAVLEKLGLLGPGPGWRAVLGGLLLAGLTVFGLAFYLKRFRPTVYGSDALLALIGLIVVGTLILSRTMPRPPYAFGVPVAAAAMLATTLIDAQVGLAVGIATSLLLSLVRQGDVTFAAALISSGAVGAFAVHHVGQRSELLRAGLAAGAVGAATVLGVAEARGGADAAAWGAMGWLLIGGLFSAVLTIGLLPFFETLFGLLTPVKLLELSNPNQPLLKRILLEAPGTYHHSLIVANLVEAALEQVGGNAVLARVGAYYHDVGKVKRPYFFAENQLGGENPHDAIPPSLSAIMISSHVKDGAEMAREARLPAPLIDFIQEHHGTTLISFFYQKARETGQLGDLTEQDFRYEGPKPRSKETAVLMLADGCEAAVRQIPKKTPEAIEEAVRRIVRARLDDGQLDLVDLTLGDLERISRAFVRILTGVYHGRVEYPTSFRASARTTEARRGDQSGQHVVGGSA